MTEQIEKWRKIVDRYALALYDGAKLDVKRLEARLAAAEAVCAAAASVASEERARDQLLCYVMGLELINRLEAWRAVAKPERK